MNILELANEFSRKIIAEGGDYKTAKSYRCHVCLLMKYYETKYNSPLHITFRDIEDYIIHLREKKLSPAYINQFIASAKRFFIINGQPKKCDNLFYQNNPLKTPNILTYKECEALTEAKIYIKHSAIINLLYYGALRRSELINLKIAHISSDRKITIVASKKRKSRVIVVPQKTIDLLREYYKQVKPKEYLFNGETGKLQYSAKSIENVVKNTAIKCGIYKKVNPHLLRSSRATHLLDNGASDMYISEFLGHEEIQTTRDYYAQLTKKGMQENFDRADELIAAGARNRLESHKVVTPDNFVNVV